MNTIQRWLLSHDICCLGHMCPKWDTLGTCVYNNRSSVSYVLIIKNTTYKWNLQMVSLSLRLMIHWVTKNHLLNAFTVLASAKWIFLQLVSCYLTLYAVSDQYKQQSWHPIQPKNGYHLKTEYIIRYTYVYCVWIHTFSLSALDMFVAVHCLSRH